MNGSAIFAVFLGGGIGAVMRYAIATAFVQRLGPGFPVATLVINIAGSLCIGFVIEFANLRAVAVSPLWRTFLAVGILGGFTTFSTFSYDTITLAGEGALGSMFLYVGASLIGGVLAAVLGVSAARLLG